MLPDDGFRDSWESIVLPEDAKERLARTLASGFVLRSDVAFEKLPHHGVVLLVGEPGVGKTTLGRGLADRVARLLGGSLGEFAYVEVDPHRLTSSSLGRSQREVESLFSQTLGELAGGGPLVVLLDEVETLATERARLSFEANPADVHRAVDAVLVGLDNLARAHPHVGFVATSNFPQAIDQALASRADLVYTLPLPDLAARRAILADSIDALAGVYPGVARLAEGKGLDRAAAAAEGMDGRRLRKAVAAMFASRDETTLDPNKATDSDLLATIDYFRREGL
jgi:SpoVK/Ycf46/Vps4 family AAA+-type ATPase